jgi:hypothetical protein
MHFYLKFYTVMIGIWRATLAFGKFRVYSGDDFRNPSLSCLSSLHKFIEISELMHLFICSVPFLVYCLNVLALRVK